MRYLRLAERENLPDLLHARLGEYLDADGLCFAPQIETTARGVAVLAVYFQNRYAGHATARVRLLPPRRRFRLARHDLPGCALDIECPGGAFGVVRRSFPIPEAYQGRRMTFSIGADAAYPDGRGELLRFRPGLPVHSVRDLSGPRRVRNSVSKLVIGQYPIASPARATLTLPQGVVATDARHAPVRDAQIIWWPELLEREYAVRQRRAAA